MIRVATTSATRVAIVAFSLSALLPGCGSGGPERVPVRGRITFNGGEWPAPGSLYFVPIAPANGYPQKPGSAPFDVDGKFIAETLQSGDGLVPGRYQVGVNCWAEPYRMGGPPRKSHVPVEYRDAATSGFEVDIDALANVDIVLNFDVPSK